jgi:hypothetical protein
MNHETARRSTDDVEWIAWPRQSTSDRAVAEGSVDRGGNCASRRRLDEPRGKLSPSSAIRTEAAKTSASDDVSEATIQSELEARR